MATGRGRSKEYCQKCHDPHRKYLLKKYYQQHRRQLRKQQQKYNQRPDVKLRKRQVYEKYNQRPDVKKRIKEYHKKYRLAGKAAAVDRKRYKKHRPKLLLQKKIKLKAMRLRVLAYYSKGTPKCKICGITGMPFLQIDHVYGRKAMGHSRYTTTTQILQDLDKNHPKGFQILCANCNMIKSIRSHKTHSNHPNAVKSRYYKKISRKKVLEHYSGGKMNCGCCGFAEIDGLSIDHIKPRREWKHDKTFRTDKLYRWLRRKNFPKGFQILCQNCNHAKRDNDICPHQNMHKNS